MTIYFPKENDNSSAVPCGPYFKYSSDIFSSFSLPINSVISRKCQHGKQIQEIIIIASVPGAERSIPEAVYTFLYMRSVRCQCRLCIDCHNGNRMQCLLFQSCSINQEHTVPVFSLLFTVKFLQPVCNLRLPRIFVIPEMIHGNVGYGAVCIAVVPVMSSEDFLMSCMGCPVIVCIFCRKPGLLVACLMQIFSAGCRCLFPEFPVSFLRIFCEQFIKMWQMIGRIRKSMFVTNLIR